MPVPCQGAFQLCASSSLPRAEVGPNLIPCGKSLKLALSSNMLFTFYPNSSKCQRVNPWTLIPKMFIFIHMWFPTPQLNGCSQLPSTHQKQGIHIGGLMPWTMAGLLEIFEMLILISTRGTALAHAPIPDLARLNKVVHDSNYVHIPLLCMTPTLKTIPLTKVRYAEIWRDLNEEFDDMSEEIEKKTFWALYRL